MKINFYLKVIYQAFPPLIQLVSRYRIRIRIVPVALCSVILEPAHSYPGAAATFSAAYHGHAT